MITQINIKIRSRGSVEVQGSTLFCDSIGRLEGRINIPYGHIFQIGSSSPRTNLCRAVCQVVDFTEVGVRLVTQITSPKYSNQAISTWLSPVLLQPIGRMPPETAANIVTV